MISDTDIRNTINDLDRLYNSQSAQSIYFSKLALLELCGWLELSMDCIILECANSKLSDQVNKDYTQRKIIAGTYGFHYDGHFRPMLMKLVGLIKLEQIELGLVASGQMAILESQLGTLDSNRKRAAHTHIYGTTMTYESPSIIMRYLDLLYPILQQYETALQAI